MAIVLHHSRAKGTDKLVLLGIANHAGDGGAWPTVATLARYANVTERAVQTSVQKLVTMGELLIDRQGGGTLRTRRDRRPNAYHVTVSCPMTCDHSINHRPRAYPVPADHLRFTTSGMPQSDGVKQTSPGSERGEADFTQRGEADFTLTRSNNHHGSVPSSTTDHAPVEPADPYVRDRALREARDNLQGWCSWPRQ